MKKNLLVIEIIISLILLIISSGYITVSGLYRNAKENDTEAHIIENTLRDNAKIYCLKLKLSCIFGKCSKNSVSTPWYCDSVKFTLEETHVSSDNLYARGIGTNKKGLVFNWAMVKEGFTNWYFYPEDSDSVGNLPKCEEIEDLPPEIFDGMFSKCLQDGKEVQR